MPGKVQNAQENFKFQETAVFLVIGHFVLKICVAYVNFKVPRVLLSIYLVNPAILLGGGGPEGEGAPGSWPDTGLADGA